MIKDKYIILLGANPLNVGYCEVATRLNAKLIIFDWGLDPGNFPDAKFITEDIKSTQVLNNIDCELDVLFAYTSSDIACENVSKIHNKLGLKFSELEKVNKICRKDLLQGVWKQYGLVTRTLLKFDKNSIFNGEILSKLMQLLERGKIVVKPSNSASSRDVSILDPTVPINNLVAHLRKLINKYDAPILVEEFIEGTEYSIEMIVDSLGSVDVWPIGVKYKSQFGSNATVSVKVAYNSKIPANLDDRIRNFARECAKATGITNSLLHLELIADNLGNLHPIEMGCRSTGFVGSHLLDYVSQKSYIESYISVLNGDRLLDENIKSNDTVSIYFFYDFPNRICVDELREDDDFWSNTKYSTHFVSNRFSGSLSHSDDTNKVFYRILTISCDDFVANDIEKTEMSLMEFLKIDI